MRVMQRLAIFSLCMFILAGCRTFVPGELPVTWVPLPTIPPLTGTLTEIPGHPRGLTLTPPPSAMSSLVPSPLPQELPKTPITEEPEARASWARDQAWAHLVSTVRDARVPSAPAWSSASVTPGVGASTFAYTAEGWLASVTVPFVPLARAIYPVKVKGPERFEWAAMVRADGRVNLSPTEAPTPFSTSEATPRPTTPPTAVSTPAATPPPTAISTTPSTPAPTVSPTPQPTTPSIATRTSTTAATAPPPTPKQPTATPAASNQLVEGWTGHMRSAPSGSAYDDYFDSQTPGGQYGITSLMPRLAEELASYRNTDVLIRVWGVLDEGVADYGGKRIVVTRIEVIQ